MARSKQQQPERAEIEPDWSDENQSRCPGYRILPYKVGSVPYEAMIRCDWTHPHQEAVKVSSAGRERVPLYPWLHRLCTEAEARRQIDRRQRKAGKRQEAVLEGAKKVHSELVRLTPEDAPKVLLEAPESDIPPEVMDWLERAGRVE